MELTVLGCGDAFGNGGRNNTSFLVSAGNQRILMDCGTTTLIRLKQEKIPLDEIDTIVISHFHGDHYGGIPFILICALFESPRIKPLNIVGPRKVKEKILALQEAMYEGTAAKLEALNLNFFEYRENEKLTVGDLSIYAFEVEHSPQSNPHGVQVHWKGKQIGFSGDTSWTEKLYQIAKGTDLFICECNYLEGVNFGHLSYEEVMKFQSQLETKQLWLSHMNEEVFASREVALNKFYDGMKIVF